MYTIYPKSIIHRSSQTNMDQKIEQETPIFPNGGRKKKTIQNNAMNPIKPDYRAPCFRPFANQAGSVEAGTNPPFLAAWCGSKPRAFQVGLQVSFFSSSALACSL